MKRLQSVYINDFAYILYVKWIKHFKYSATLCPVCDSQANNTIIRKPVTAAFSTLQFQGQQ